MSKKSQKQEEALPSLSYYAAKIGDNKPLTKFAYSNYEKCREDASPLGGVVKAYPFVLKNFPDQVKGLRPCYLIGPRTIKQQRQKFKNHE